MAPESFSGAEDVTTPSAEQIEKIEKNEEETRKIEREEKEESSPEVIEKKASEFDAELGKTIQERIDAGTLTPEDAEMLSKEAQDLKPDEKAELAGKLKDIESSSENAEELEAQKEFQERFAGYEKSVDDLVERAKALGIEVSPEGLKGYLEKMKNAEPEQDDKEREEWNKSFEMRIGALEAQMKRMERMKELDMLSSEKGKEVQQEFKASFDQLVEQAVKFAVKLAVAVFKGLYKGIMGALKKKER